MTMADAVITATTITYSVTKSTFEPIDYFSDSPCQIVYSEQTMETTSDYTRGDASYDEAFYSPEVNFDGDSCNTDTFTTAYSLYDADGDAITTTNLFTISGSDLVIENDGSDTTFDCDVDFTIVLEHTLTSDADISFVVGQRHVVSVDCPVTRESVNIPDYAGVYAYTYLTGNQARYSPRLTVIRQVYRCPFF